MLACLGVCGMRSMQGKRVHMRISMHACEVGEQGEHFESMHLPCTVWACLVTRYTCHSTGWVRGTRVVHVACAHVRVCTFAHAWMHVMVVHAHECMVHAF